MIPILYEATETEFKTNGIGRPIFSECSVHEVLNGEYELEATLPSSDKHFKDIKNGLLILASTELGSQPQPFQIYDVEKDDKDGAKIKAEHISYRLSHIPVLPFTAKTPSEAFSNISSKSVVTNPFTFDTDVKPDEGSMTVEKPETAKSLLGDSDNQIIGTFHTGEYKYDRFRVSLLERRGRDTNVYIRYGKDISTITQDENIEDTVTSILPYYKKDKNFTYLPGYLYDTASASKYPYKRIEIVDVSSEFKSVPSSADITTYCEKYAKEHDIGVPKLELTIEFAQLWEAPEYKETASRMEKLCMGDMVHVIFPSVGVTATGEIIEYEWNVLTDKYDSMTIGNYVNNILNTIVNVTRGTKTFESKKDESSESNDKSGSVYKTTSSANEKILLLSDSECDMILGLKPNTSNENNTVANFTSIKGTVNDFHHESGGWYGSAVGEAGEYGVGYSIHYYGDSTTSS